MMKYSPSEPEEITGNENTVKFSTVVFFVLGLVIPLWVVTLPLFWFIAYCTFKSGGGTPISKGFSQTSEKPVKRMTTASKYDDLEKLKKLLDAGALTEQEYSVEKSKVLSL